MKHGQGGLGGASLLRQVPRVTLLLLFVPVLAGLLGTLAPAFGTGEADWRAAFDSLAAWPGLRRAIALSLASGLVATVLSLAITLLLVASLADTAMFAALRRLLSPLLAIPHAAAALGLAFLIAPSGWIVRALSPWATGWTAPPDVLILNDPWGASLTLGLITKEVPFLLLMTLASLPQTDAARRMAIATSLGYGQVAGFVLCVLPPLYRQLRLPVYAVLAYAMTAVEMAMILGPTLPPTLAVKITHWMTDPSLAHRGTAAAAALVQLVLVVAALLGWHLAERFARAAVLRAAGSGRRWARADPPLRLFAVAVGFVVAGLLITGLIGLAVWSFAGLWQFPAALPASLNLTTWMKSGPDLARTAGVTAAIALLATGAAAGLVLACLEAEHRFGLTADQRALWLLYLPLIVPQIAFLPGLQRLTLALGAENGVPAVAAVHLVFVLPYVFLSLGPAFRAWDGHFAVAGAALGATPAKVFWRLRLPMLLGPVLTAVAVGVSVSVAQYLPSLLIGGGRVETLTTEAVALSSGGNRRIIGAYGLMQMLLPSLGFAVALAVPRLVFRHRAGMRADLRAGSSGRTAR